MNKWLFLSLMIVITICFNMILVTGLGMPWWGGIFTGLLCGGYSDTLRNKLGLNND